MLGDEHQVAIAQNGALAPLISLCRDASTASGKEAAEVGRDTQLANSMGLFLQKTNIIRDYLEDGLEGREFWPQEVCACVHVGGWAGGSS